MIISIVEHTFKQSFLYNKDMYYFNFSFSYYK
jgi:hypothetical protein